MMARECGRLELEHTQLGAILPDCFVHWYETATALQLDRETLKME